MSSSKQDLNSRQLLAVEHGDGPLLIFAGAGSGKTRVLSRRIAFLLEENYAQAHEILAVTFTNKAAKEMRSRIEGLISSRAREVWISTFHSMCIRILRKHADLIGYQSSFAVYDSSDSKAAMKRVFKRQKIDAKNVDPKMVLRSIDKAKNDNLCPEGLKNSGQAYGQFTNLIASLYREYQEELRRSNAMDFGDLLFQTLRLLKQHPQIASLYQNNFRYILVDEYQDTNHVQYLLIKTLSSVHKNICVVGDDDQSIYGFRGACVETILNFKTDFPNAQVITLSTNYRSTQTILSAASAVIAHNKRRQEKGMRTDNPEGSLLREGQG
jgi:DNA helicase-2/ATP-dependent DNA helicase PcrA